MANIWEKAISILARNLNSGFSFHIATVCKQLVITHHWHQKSWNFDEKKPLFLQFTNFVQNQFVIEFTHSNSYYCISRPKIIQGRQSPTPYPVQPPIPKERPECWRWKAVPAAPVPLQPAAPWGCSGTGFAGRACQRQHSGCSRGNGVWMGCAVGLRCP